MVDQLIDDHTRECFPEYTDLALHLHAIGAYDSGKFIGGIVLRCQYDTAHVGSLAVDPNYRGLKIGSRLIQEAEAYLDAIQVHTVTLSTLNYQALGFYLKLGYQLHGQLDDLPTRGMTKYFLYKRLAAYSEDEGEK